MTTRGKRLAAAAGAGVIVVAVCVLGLLRGERERSPAGSSAQDPGGAGFRGYAAGTPGIAGPDGEHAPAAAPAAPGGAPAPTVQAQVDTAMGAWRTAVLVKDADTVMALDRAFAEMPARYGPSLIKSAQSDDSDRVRAFSTRVLGKLKTPELATLFAQLLDDKSPYVRQNAAWALGELGARPDGREAARRAVADLQRLGQRDAAKDVRVEANMALKRLQ
jgi:HEAT repeats